ncbi:MAG: alpha/beta fold hydrolase [Bacillus sp. (in: firmicutes)]
MFYKIYGDQKSNKVLITLPALGERKEMYEELANRLREYKVISFDLPGHNQSISDDYSILAYIEKINETLDDLKITSAHFIGNSIGGWIIQEIYKVYPQKVSSLLLLDGGFYFLGEREDMEEKIKLPVIDKLEDLKEAINDTVNNMEGLNKDTYSKLKDYMFSNFVHKNNTYIHHSNEDALNVLHKEILTSNHCLPNDVDIPVGLVIAQNNLDDVSRQKLIEFKSQYPLAKVKVIENGYHFLPITNTEEVADFIQTFL